MKRTLIAAAAVLAAGTAFAQSSVTLYGRVNTSVERQKVGDATRTVLQDSASRWGLRGSEDLGGGLKALFVLESGFGSDTGALSTAYGAGRLFQRESWVGVESSSFGRVRLGNMGQSAAYYATADYISMHNHDTGTSSDAFYLYPGRKQNAISYNTPSFGGLVVEAQYSMRQDAANVETTSNATGKNTAQIAANYDRGPLHLGATYLRGPLDFGFQGVAFAGFAGGVVNDTKEYGLRALYEFGPLTVGAYWVHNQIDPVGAEIKRDAFRLSGMYTIGGNELHLNVGYADKFKLNGTKVADSDALQYTVAYNYNLSKRTKVYAFYTKVDNKANVSYFGTGANGVDFSSFALGVRHAF